MDQAQNETYEQEKSDWYDEQTEENEATFE